MPTNGDLPNNIRQDADDANAQICRYVREQNKLMKIHYTIYRLLGEKGGISSFTGDGEVFDEIVHPWLASARHAQRHQDGHVANDNEDEKDPQESQLLRLIGRKKIVRLFISEPLESEPQRHRRLIASRLPPPIDKRKRRNRTDTGRLVAFFYLNFRLLWYRRGCRVALYFDSHVTMRTSS